MNMFRTSGFVLGVPLLLLVAGCGPPPNVTVTGTILKGGQPIQVSPTGVLQVTLRPDVGEDEEYTSKIGECDRAGSFRITDVPPGKYKVGIEQFDPTPQIDKLNGAFHPGSSKIKRDIDGKVPLSIDLAKPE